MGYNEALASALWVKFILYFATSSKKAVPDKSQATELPNPKVIASGDKNNSVDYIQAVTSLDTHFHAAYLHGARLTLYHKGIISRETVEMSAAILQKGLQYFPADGELMFHLGFLYYYEMLPFVKNETEKRKFKRKGTMIIQKASNMSNAPGYASMLASGLLEKEGMDELVIQHLQAMLVQEQPPEIRDNLTRELSVLLDDQAQKDFLKYNELYDRWQKDMNFIPFDLFMILAP
ncbi:MAG: hypothetical protein JXR76_29290 [Deltaproteobacteria bacterium]|nr:hypothetical protein [Deltaproteobacteria bacterium]